MKRADCLSRQTISTQTAFHLNWLCLLQQAQARNSASLLEDRTEKRPTRLTTPNQPFPARVCQPVPIHFRVTLPAQCETQSHGRDMRASLRICMSSELVMAGACTVGDRPLHPLVCSKPDHQHYTRRLRNSHRIISTKATSPLSPKSLCLTRAAVFRTVQRNECWKERRLQLPPNCQLFHSIATRVSLGPTYRVVLRSNSETYTSTDAQLIDVIRRACIWPLKLFSYPNEMRLSEIALSA